ncbi:MAG: hypothetical protein HC880_20310 [Bacteroidia bacterium]|nr:hypothetical protein [Bacteroidia bacterium]
MDNNPVVEVFLTEKVNKYRRNEVPAYLVRERLDGQPYKKNNLASDIAIFDRAEFYAQKLSNHYTQTIPKVVVEVEVYDEDNLTTDPFTSVPIIKKPKTAGLGVEEVIWVFPQLEKTTYARRREEDWITTHWSKNLKLLRQLRFFLG